MDVQEQGRPRRIVDLPSPDAYRSYLVVGGIPMIAVSRQRRWQLRKQKAGLCTGCGSRPPLSGDKCERCLNGLLKKVREKRGNRPWRPGSKGRPLISLLTRSKMAGRCWLCRLKLDADGGCQKCETTRKERKTLLQRLRRGYRPWEKGGRGRPPKTSRQMATPEL